MISAGVGIGTGENAYSAARDATLGALSGVLDHKAKTLLVFGSVSFDQDELLRGVADTAPETKIIGCSTAGEISSEGLSSEKSVVIMALGGDELDVETALGNHLLWNARQAGFDCAKELQYASHGYLQAGIVFTDVIAGNGELAVDGMRERLGPSIPLTGAAAGDDLLFFETYQYFGDRAYSGSVASLGLSGKFVVASAVADGFLPIGMPRRITKSEGVTVQQIDNARAVSVYEDYFGSDYSSELHEHLLSDLAVTFPLGIMAPDSDRLISRNPIYADEKGGMIFTAPIPEGSAAHIMISDTAQTLSSARDAAERIMKEIGAKKPRAALVFNSIARKKLLGSDADEEIHIIQNIIGREVPLAGFYGYAQIDSPISGEKPFYNASLVIWVLAA